MTMKAVVLLIKIPSVSDALTSQPSTREGSAAFPVPPTTPFADVNAESRSIRIGAWIERGADGSDELAVGLGPETRSMPHAKMAARTSAEQRIGQSLRKKRCYYVTKVPVHERRYAEGEIRTPEGLAAHQISSLARWTELRYLSASPSSEARNTFSPTLNERTATA